jgi:phage-related tail protein
MANSDSNQVQESVSDMLKIESEAMAKLRKATGELLTEMRQEREEMAKDREELNKLTELFRDLNKEYDRLTERVSTQVKALIMAIDDLKA